MIRRSTLIAVEILLGLVAAFVIGIGVAWWRLSQGPIELNSIRDHVEARAERRALGTAGRHRARRAGLGRRAALELRAVGVTVEDGRGGVLSRSDERADRTWRVAAADRAHLAGAGGVSRRRS